LVQLFVKHVFALSLPLSFQVSIPPEAFDFVVEAMSSEDQFEIIGGHSADMPGENTVEVSSSGAMIVSQGVVRTQWLIRKWRKFACKLIWIMRLRRAWSFLGAHLKLYTELK
jgi:hypothetical protein